MSFPRYPAYKDSGVEWLGEVPQNWSVYSLKRTVDGCVNGLWGDEPDGENDIAVIRVADFERSFSTVGLDKLTYRSITRKERQSRLIKSGDLLIEKSGGGEKTLVGCVVLFTHEFDAITSNFVARMRPLAEFDSQFLCYAFGNLYHGRVNYPSVKQVTGIQNLDAESYLQERFCFPARVEQTQIARFLDHETARIDALIEEQQRLIELLKEKRQAVISHAVTKGLDPKVPMKHSGVEWLGEVPAHWVVRKLKNLVSVRGGSTPSKEVERYWEGDIPWVSPKDMKSERISDSIDHVSDSAIKDGGLNMVKGGAILIVVRGMILIHSVPVAITDVDVTINQDMKAMTPCAELSSDYLSLLLQGVRDAVFQYIDSSAHGTRKLEWERFELINLPVPSHSEQNSIVSSIEMQKRAIDDLTEQAASAITLMKERRSALISAAVTGKIDVRGWQPSASVPIPELVQEAV
ncbi:restriction endonuclease subunit S [Pseudomonas lactis]|uniref:restriction endonuclease subunit S n=1 Tax=Pseudomonas lactis TaxID=1615674 RepID=UPI002856CAB6|nr:restriction endonuclease subunit S [Pseudomonas lactis]MDR8371825.1 restriction endonuclease subunit S [Pseudomonas lactis]